MGIGVCGMGIGVQTPIDYAHLNKVIMNSANDQYEDKSQPTAWPVTWEDGQPTAWPVTWEDDQHTAWPVTWEDGQPTAFGQSHGKMTNLQPGQSHGKLQPGQ